MNLRCRLFENSRANLRLFDLDPVVPFAERLIAISGHRFYPFMYYRMPEHVYRDADPCLRRQLGFLPSGAYG